MMPAIEFRHFSKRYPGFSLEDLSFRVETGFITGLIGPNGSGKTTLLRSVMNLVRPEHGDVTVFGQQYRNAEREIKRRIGFVYDEDVFYGHLTVSEMRRIAASFYQSWSDDAFRAYLRDFGLIERKRILDLSRGMRTKLALAIALAHEPELLIMDEPTSGLDPVFRREVLAILAEYISGGERTVLFSTHITADLERIADFIVYVLDGQLQFSGSKEELLDRYLLVKGPAESAKMGRVRLLGLRQTTLGFEGLLPRESYFEGAFAGPITAERPSLDDILVHTQEAK